MQSMVKSSEDPFLRLFKNVVNPDANAKMALVMDLNIT